MMTVLAIVVALVIDLGLVIRDRAAGQSAADAAALAGATVLTAGDTAAAAEQMAIAYVALNGFDGAGDGLVVESPPTTGPYASNPACISVFVSRTRSALFSSVAGFEILDSDATAVACTEPGLANYAIIALNETDCASIALNGNVTIDVQNAGIWANSNCSVNALTGNGTVDASAQAIDVIGGCQLIGNASLTPPCTHPADPIPDPLGSLPVPTPPAGPTQTCPGNGTKTLQPGVYNCQIRPGGNSNFTFMPGNYLITGGIYLNGNVSATFGDGEYTLQGNGLKVNGGADMTANEAVFYVDQGTVDLSGTADLELMAPTAGAYEGVVIFQNRSNSNDLEVHGTAAVGNWGTIYAAAARVVYQGNASTNFQFVVDKFTTGGNTNTTIVFDENFTIEPAGGVKLVS